MTIILLAAGLSRRMGAANKLLLPFNDKTIFETTLNNILAADLGEIVVVVGHESEKIKNILDSYPKIKIAENTHYNQGMTSSIQAGVKIMNEQSESIMICLSDMPHIQPDEYKLMAHFFSENIQNDKKLIVQPQFENQNGNPIVFSIFYKPEIFANKNPEGCRDILQKYKTHVKKIEMTTNSILRDIDTSEEYSRSYKL